MQSSPPVPQVRHALIGGLPGTGKTRLGLALAAALSAGIAGRPAEPVLVVHTDVLKVTLRTLGGSLGRTLRGPGWSGDFAAKAAVVAPLLTAQLDKAETDGYRLIIEGTLTLGFHDPRCHELLLRASPEVRARRVQAKHPSAKESLEAVGAAEMAPYAEVLMASRTPQTWLLDADLEGPTLTARVIERLYGSTL